MEDRVSPRPKTTGINNDRLTPAYGLTTIPELKKLHRLDLRRTGASIALVRSMQTRTVRMSPRPETSPPALLLPGMAVSPRMSHESTLQDPMSYAPSKTASILVMNEHVNDEIENIIQEEVPQQEKSRDRRRRKTIEWTKIVTQRMNNEIERDRLDIANLEDAFYAISASFDMDGDGTIDSEELIHIFTRCQLFDEWLTPSKVRDYFRTAAEGCNHVLRGIEAGFQDGIDYEDFESVLRWSADMKGADFSRCVARVLRLSRKLCDGRSSDRRKLETVFDAFCKTQAEIMTLYEFATLCKKLNVYDPVRFTVADVYSIYYTANNVGQEGLNFEGFMNMLSIVGDKLGVGEKVFKIFADGISKLDIDEPTIRKVKMKIKHAASSASNVGWRQFFHECDEDNSGHMDWEEFYNMCRVRLHLSEKANHLKILFEKLDKDDSGELGIDELIEFIEQG